MLATPFIVVVKNEWSYCIPSWREPFQHFVVVYFPSTFVALNPTFFSQLVTEVSTYLFNCNWVDTRWQQYSTHLHTNRTQNTENGTYITIKKIGNCGPCPVFASYTLTFALQLRKKHRKTSVRVVEKCPDIPVAVVQYTFTHISLNSAPLARGGLELRPSTSRTLCYSCQLIARVTVMLLVQNNGNSNIGQIHT
jgi:hypothetical protein